MTKSTNLKKGIIAAVLAAVMLILFLVGTGGASAAHAATYLDTLVLEDLRKDSTFSESDYPAIKNDYSLQVIQIAESSDGELLIYVYQPSAKTKTLTATTINISTAINDNLKYQNYKLTLLGASGVFAKYRVEDFTVKSDVVRYYDISSIFRAYDSGIDSPASGGNLISEVAYEVAQLWTACTLNGTVTYEMIYDEVITITDKYVGYVRYVDGYNFWGSYIDHCDSHYVAFSTDYDIDKLYEADISFITQSSHHYLGGNSGTDGITTLGDKVDNFKSLNYTDVVSNSGNMLWGKKYTWNRIEKVSDFIRNEDLKDETKAQLQGKKWVLRFYETEFTEQYSGSPASGNFSINRYSTLVSDVTILRLKFETAGKVYNLGVVDNKQHKEPNSPPDNNVYFDFGSWWDSIKDWVKSIKDTLKTALIVIFSIIILVVVVWLIVKLTEVIRNLSNKK